MASITNRPASDLLGLGVELFDQPHDVFEKARSGADQQAVADRFGNDNHFALDLLEGADQARIGCFNLPLS